MVLINGRNSFERWNTLAQPKQLMFWYYPTWYTDSPDSHVNMYNGNRYLLNYLRARLQEADSIKPNFYYLAPTMKFKESQNDSVYRKPVGTELRSMIMLALAHGAKGIFFMHYYSYWVYNNNGVPIYSRCEGLVDTSFNRSVLWYFVKDSLTNRINGNFGKTLLGLKYTGNYLTLRKNIGYGNEGSSNNFVELIDPTASSDTLNFHGGFLHDSLDMSYNKYFLLVNVKTNEVRTIKIKATNAFSGFTNIRFRDIEGSIDTTFTDSCTTPTQYIKAGDGKLYQIAPVVKYGGKLIADENVGEGMILSGDMSIESGATLYVYGEYNANADITIKPGGKIVSGDNGRIIFLNDHKLITEGSAQINGSSNNRLEIVFKGSNSGGIKIKPNSTLKAFYCNIVGVNGAKSGILSESLTRSVIMENVTISGFKESGVVLLGSFRENIPDITPTIKNCVIENCGLGISAANFAEFVILGNTITDCKMGIFISQIPTAHIIGNNITFTTTPVLPGIFMTSSNGNVRGNTVRSHTIGIFLANSSPNIGGNTLEDNSEHGLYVGSGSKPNLRRGLAGPLPLVIATSGYNIIKENGYEGFGPMNGDGSEIYLNESSIILDYGCNQIIDDRQIPESMLLMNGTNMGTTRVIEARYNYWGTITPTAARFGNLSVIYEPFNPGPNNSGPCLTPQSACYVIEAKTSKGELIDEIDAKNCESGQLSALEESYAEAEKYYLNGETNSAKEIYEQITEGEGTAEEKLYAYNKLYAIGNLIDTANNYFSNLQIIFNNFAETVSDSTLMDIFTQNSILCKVSKEEYLSAINDFDNIVQQNPQSEKAVYAEMDILTTTLLMDTTNNQLGKVAGGKYLIKGGTDYLSKLNEIMNKNFGKGSKEKENIIPTEYSLSQNYPNPFNPTTKIKYQIPNTAQVSLKVYDILGREITSLVNEEKQAGYYEPTFNASNLSSGCYFYQIVTKDFVKTMKMLVVK